MQINMKIQLLILLSLILLFNSCGINDSDEYTAPEISTSNVDTLYTLPSDYDGQGFFGLKSAGGKIYATTNEFMIASDANGGNLGVLEDLRWEDFN